MPIKYHLPKQHRIIPNNHYRRVPIQVVHLQHVLRKNELVLSHFFLFSVQRLFLTLSFFLSLFPCSCSFVSFTWKLCFRSKWNNRQKKRRFLFVSFRSIVLSRGNEKNFYACATTACEQCVRGRSSFSFSSLLQLIQLFRQSALFSSILQPFLWIHRSFQMVFFVFFGIFQAHTRTYPYICSLNFFLFLLLNCCTADADRCPLLLFVFSLSLSFCV